MVPPQRYYEAGKTYLIMDVVLIYKYHVDFLASPVFKIRQCCDSN